MTINLPLVSTIIPIYNREKYLESAVKSVLDTKYPYLEIVLVDDGSSDSSWNIVQYLSTKYPKIVRSFCHVDHLNLGISQSRNLGIKESKGDIICFLDSDDLYLPCRFEQSVSMLIEHHELLAVYEPVVSLDDCENFEEQRYNDNLLAKLSKNPSQGEFIPEKVFNKILYGCFLWNTPSITIKRSAFKEVGLFSDKFKTSEDTHLWLRLAATNKVCCVQDNHPVALVRRHKQNISLSLDKENNNLILFKVYIDVYHKIKDNKSSRLLLKKRINIFFWEMILCYQKENFSLKMLCLFMLEAFRSRILIFYLPTIILKYLKIVFK